MEIQFTNINNLWVAEFEVTKDFNLHLERDTEGRLDIYQRTAGGDYEYIYDIGYLNKRTVYDNDFQALVYPKWIKIKSAVKPLVATITTDGEVNEVVYQAKDIEITSNGTTKVTADAGYTALGSVNVKVNVPTDGGGSGDSGGGNVRYFNVQKLHEQGDDMFRGLLCACPGLLAIKQIDSQSVIICSLSYIATEYYPGITQIAILDDFRGFIDGSNDLNTSEFIQRMLSFGCTEITKEEFYDLNA